MGTTHIEINHVSSRSPSVASQQDDLNENGVHVSPGEISPQYSVVHPESHSGSSSHPNDFVHLQYPGELHEGEANLYDTASRISEQERQNLHVSRSNSNRREPQARQPPPLREPIRVRTRDQFEPAPTESGDSTEEFLLRSEYGARMPRPQSYHGHNGYTHSSSSGSYGYPPIPPSNQMIQFQPPPVPSPYQQQYPPHMGGPQPMGYPPSHMGYPQQYGAAPPSSMTSPYGGSPYGPPSAGPYGPPSAGYFPGQFQQFPPQYSAHYAQLYQQQMLPMNPYVDLYRVQSPPHAPSPISAPPAPAAPPAASTPNPAPAAASAPPSVDPEKAKAEQEQLIKRMEALMKEQNDKRLEAELSKEQALKQAADKVQADAIAAAERMAAEAKIREEARLEAIRAYEEKVRAAAEQAAREQQIRKEAADAALKAAAEEATKKAERAAYEKKLADDAAAAAKTAAEKQAADAAAAAKEVAKKAQEEAEKKLKDAEEAAAKAKAEAEAAQKKVAEATPAEKKAPVRFKDAIGRNYNFPFERCCKWRDMEGLINQAFAHINELSEHVYNRRYDLLGPDKEIIMPGYWESTIEPDMQITMMLWPLPEPKKDEPLPPLDPLLGLPDDILVLGDMDPKKPPRSRSQGPKKKTRPGGLSMWMLGGAPSKSSKQVLKDDKKPAGAAVPQHDTTDAGACVVM